MEERKLPKVPENNMKDKTKILGLKQPFHKEKKKIRTVHDAFCSPLVLHSCWHKKESCHINLKLLVRMLEYYSNKASTMILFRIQIHPSKPETERDGLNFILLGTLLEKMPFFFSPRDAKLEFGQERV